MFWILVPMIVSLGAYLALTSRHIGYLSPGSLFLYFQLIMALGTVPLLEVQRTEDVVHGLLILSTFIIVAATLTIMGLGANASRYGKRAQRTKSVTFVNPGTLVFALLGLSLVVCVLYYVAVGYSAFLAGLISQLTGGAADVAELRLKSYSGESYYFPGYVNQFKNALLPASICVVVPYLYRKHVTGRLIISGTLVLLALAFILGTGQRGAFVTFMIVLFMYVFFAHSGRLSGKSVLVGASTIAVFMVSSFALGRTENSLDHSQGAIDRLGALLGGVANRIFDSNQIASVAGFRYIYDQPPAYGLEWLEAVGGLLPGLTGSNLANVIYASLYGTMRGTAPPSIWGSVYANFGFVGAIIFSVIYAVILHNVGWSVRKHSSLNSIQAIGMAGVTVTLGSWVAGSPVYLLNVGLAVYILLWWWGNRVSRKVGNGDPGGKPRYFNLRPSDANAR